MHEYEIQMYAYQEWPYPEDSSSPQTRRGKENISYKMIHSKQTPDTINGNYRIGKSVAKHLAIRV